MHVVISGYYGFDNVGDEAILLSIIQALRQVQPKIEITVLSHNPEKTANTYQVKAVNRWRLSDVRQAIKQADGLISGGGSLLQDQTGIRSIPYYAGVIKLAQWLGKPTFVYAQGMGPFNRMISRWIVKHVLNRVDAITVRDESSQKLLKSVGVTKEITIVPDPVLGLDVTRFENNWVNQQPFMTGAMGHIDVAPHPNAGDDPMNKTSELTPYPANRTEFITVSVRDWPSPIPYLQLIAGGLDQLAKLGYQIVFVPMHGEFDKATSQKTASLMQEKSYIAPADLSIEEKVSIIGESELLIGMRLHSLVFAAANHVPFIALSYDPKIDAFAEICEQPLIGHVEEDTWSADDLFAQASRSLEFRVIQQDILKNKTSTFKAQALETAKKAINTFKQ